MTSWQVLGRFITFKFDKKRLGKSILDFIVTMVVYLGAILSIGALLIPNVTNIFFLLIGLVLLAVSFFAKGFIVFRLEGVDPNKLKR